MKKYNLEAPPRQRTSVPIQGLDLITPDDTVADGKCQILHNMRYEGGAWRPTHPYTLKKDGVAYDIRYNHNFDGTDRYIYYSNGYYYYNKTAIVYLSSSTKITHFGKVLIFYSSSSITYYILSNGSYRKFTSPSYCKTKELYSEDYHNYSPTRYFEEDTYKYHEYNPENIPTNATEYWYPIANTSKGLYLLESSNKYWSGEILLFTTYRMADGTLLSPSPLHLIKSDRAETTTKRGIWTGADPFESQGISMQEASGLDKYLAIRTSKMSDNALRRHKPTLRITASSSEFIESVCVWSTRIHPTFEVDPTKWDNTRDGIAKAYANNDLPNQPFYLVKEIPLSQFSNYAYDLTLDAELLNNAIHAPVYKPNMLFSPRPTITFDYNERLHIAGYTYDLPDLFSIEDSNLVSGDVGYSSSTEQTEEIVRLDVDNVSYSVANTARTNSQNGLRYGTPFYRIISYPDFRANEYIAEERYYAILNEAVGINMAWHHQAHTPQEKYPPIVVDTRVGTNDDDWGDNRTVNAFNKIQVSTVNNCFNLPFDNNYTVGSSSNKIIALNSPSIEMHEMKIGELPLYAFTEEGIFALQAGSDTLYASVVPINHDRIINPNTLAINNSIVYATERGIHMLRGSENVIISTPIHKNGIVPIDKFKTCTFINPKGYNELVVLLSDGSGAYIYNLDSGYWSTRTLSGRKLNTDELVVANDDGVYDLTDEVETECQTPQIITRPIKLGTLEYKRVETMIPRIQRNPEATCGFYCQLWHKWNSGLGDPMGKYTLDKSGNPIGIRRTGSSSQYFIFEFVSSGSNVKIGPDFSITNIDFEWYERFRRRMR